MTLILAGITDDLGYLVADTLVTPELMVKGLEGPVNGDDHALKIHILNDGLTAVAFAGNLQTATASINAVVVELEAKPDLDIPAYLVGCLRDDPSKCDFIVLDITPGRRGLTLIEDGRARDVQRAFIGLVAERQEVEGLRLPYDPPKWQTIVDADGSARTEPLQLDAGEIEFCELSSAMERRVQTNKDDRDIGAIAGCVVRVAEARISRKLEYLQVSETSITPWEGRSGFSFLASNRGVRGMAVYYEGGKFGFVMKAGDSQSCRLERAQSKDEFVALAASKFGLNLE
jgi:hypothetical protein